ncbi:hypothetical protein HK104_009077 [Borealophlyctis nickersoniae]|nr:hypothetical protein HK104_009077 [Borealophlyctis nickersoniae]
MSWGNLIVWLVLPWALRTTISYFKKPAGPVRPPKPRTRADLISTVFLLIAAFYEVASFYFAPPNLLADLRVPAEAPTYVLRNQFREYMGRKFPGWTEEVADGTVAYGGAEWAKNPRLLAEAEALSRTYTSLRNVENRGIYLRYGHHTLTGCSWCKEDVDYAGYSMPGIVKSYAFALSCLGLGTVVWRKAQWRTYGTIGMTLMAGAEAYLIYLDRNVEFNDRGIAWSPFNFYYRVRCLAFAALLLLSAVVERKDEWTDGDILSEIVAKNQVIYNRQTAFKLAKAATLGDTNLRKKFMEFHKQQEAAKDAIDRDLEFQEMRDKVLQAYNLEQLMQGAEGMAGNIMAAALHEGILTGVDLPPKPEVDVPQELGVDSQGTTYAVERKKAVVDRKGKKPGSEPAGEGAASGEGSSGSPPLSKRKGAARKLKKIQEKETAQEGEPVQAPSSSPRRSTRLESQKVK